MRYPAALSYSVHFTRHTAAVRYPAALSIVSVSNRHPAAVRYPAALSIASVSIVIPQECGIQQRCLKRPSLSSSRSSAVSSSPVTASVSNRHTAAVRYPVALSYSAHSNRHTARVRYPAALSIASVSIVIPQQCCIQQRCLKRPFLSSSRSSAVSSSPVTASVSNRHTAAVRYPVALSIASVSIVIPQQCGIQQRCLKRPFLSSYRSSAVFRSKALCNTFK